MADSDETRMVEAIRQSDPAAFRQLYERYARLLHQFLFHRTPDRETAADLVQETFIRVWQHRRDLDPSRSIRAYLIQVARNLAIDHLRKKLGEGHSEPLDERKPAPAIDPEAFIKRDRIREAVAALPASQRAVFCLSRFEALTYREIAEVLALSEKTVEVHMGRALKKLRKQLHDLTGLIFFTPIL